MLAKKVKRQQHGGRPTAAHTTRNITVSTAEGRIATTRIPGIVETSQQQY
jgi:hypothetical protein